MLSCPWLTLVFLSNSFQLIMEHMIFKRTEDHHVTITTHTSHQVEFFQSLIFSRWRLNPESGYYHVDLAARLSQWAHYAFVLHGIGEGEGDGFTLHENGVPVGTLNHSNGTWNVAGPGAMVIGKRYVNEDGDYVSVVVDELLMWNRKLTQPEIQQIFDMN